jgi:HK97 family phage major capsid protein
LFIAGGTAEGIQNAAPGTLSGYKITINQDMPDIGAGNKSIIFGDFSKYKIRRVRDAQLVRLDQRFIDKLQIGLLMFQRYDGNLCTASGAKAVQTLQHPAS